MPQYQPWSAPSKREEMEAALLAALTANLSAASYVVKRRANQQAVLMLIQQSDYPRSGRALVVQLRGGRRKTGDFEVKGTTRDLWAVSIPIALVVWDEDEDARSTTLDAAEVALVNVIHQLDVDTDFSGLARSIEFEGFEPTQLEAEGNVPPHAASVGLLTATVWE